MEKSMVFVDTIPIDARSKGSINLGYEIVASKSGADCCYWRDIPDNKYETYMFNIYYPMHIFNMMYFLRKNGIPELSVDRKNIKIIVGGQGVSNLKGCLDNIVDETYKGEYDSDTEINGWKRASVLSSDPILKNKTSMIELTRGCKYKCAFCEYSWVHGGKFREKNFEQVKDDIKYVKENGNTKSTNFLSANLGSYSKLEELIDYCGEVKTTITNTDVCLNDIKHAKKHFQNLKAIKVGIESFSEKKRAEINKGFTDIDLENFITWGANNLSSMHFYLIYGLPNDDYNAWYTWLEKLGKIRKSIKDRPIRMEFSITNFEPCIGTPLEKASWVNFTEKDYFLKHWTNALREYGFRLGDKEITYANGRGKLGRKEPSYLSLMLVKTRDSSITNAIRSSFPYGATRSLDDNRCNDFIEYCKN